MGGQYYQHMLENLTNFGGDLGGGGISHCGTFQNIKQ